MADSDEDDEAGTEGADPESVAPDDERSQRRLVLKVILASLLVVALLTGVGVAALYRHLNGNLTVDPIEDQLGVRPTKPKVTTPDEPLNVLVMGSDDRDAPGNDIDGLTGGDDHSDTTILFHLSADRERAYGISIPRDSLVTRPTCFTEDHERIPGGPDEMWNDAFTVGGKACTVHQFEKLTGIFVDHYVVVDFAGFESMVDAIGGVPVCIPETIVDPEHGINLEAGEREISGREALTYVRVRYDVGDGTDLGRIKRQQEFIGAMAKKLLRAGTLARVDRVVRFLDAATASLETDLENVLQIARIAVGFQHIGLDHITFVTVPNEYDQRPEYEGRVVWLPSARRLWEAVIADEPLPGDLAEGAVSAAGSPGGGGGSGPGASSDSNDDGICD